MLAVVGEFETGNKFAVTIHLRHALVRVVIVDTERLISAGCCDVNTAQIQTQLDQRSLIRMRALECLRVLGILRSVNANVAILTSRQNVLRRAVDLHVVKRVFPGAIVAPGELIVLIVSEDDRLIGTARNHLNGETAADELHRSDAARVIVERLQNLIFVLDVEHVNETIATGAG